MTVEKAAQAHALQNAPALAQALQFPTGFGVRALAPLFPSDDQNRSLTFSASTHWTHRTCYERPVTYHLVKLESVFPTHGSRPHKSGISRAGLMRLGH